jgi:large subunit ribosomal protein L4
LVDLNLDLWWKSKTIDSWIHSFNSGQKIGLISLDKNIFGANQRKDLIAKAVKYEVSWKEQGTESTKNLGQVRGSTRKPFPQKGRGKARVGTLRAPHFRGGYASHGPRPHNKSTDIPKKVYDAGLRSAISTKYAQDQILIVDSLELSQGSKSALEEKLENLLLKGKKVYFIYGDQEPNVKLIKASDFFSKKRNITHGEVENPILVSWAQHISVLPILDNEFLVLDKTAVEVLEEMYSIK